MGENEWDMGFYHTYKYKNIHSLFYEEAPYEGDRAYC